MAPQNEDRDAQLQALLPESYLEKATSLGFKSGEADVLGVLLLSELTLTVDAAPLLKGGRELCSVLLEEGLRAGPDGFVRHPKGKVRSVDDAIERLIEAKFPTPTKTVRNEVTLNGCVVWFSVADDAYWVEAPESQPRMVMSAAAACALCDSGSAADTIYAGVVALRETPTVVVSVDDARTAL